MLTPCRLKNVRPARNSQQSGAYYDIWLDGEKFMTSYMEVGTPWREAAGGRETPPVDAAVWVFVSRRRCRCPQY
jgi:hypothetical protein